MVSPSGDTISLNSQESEGMYMNKTYELIQFLDKKIIAESQAWTIGKDAFLQAEELIIMNEHTNFHENKLEFEDRIENLSFKSLTLMELGALFGGLRRINNFTKSQKIALFIKELRAYVFENCIEDGKVINKTSGQKLTYEMLLACNPFGLFEPEDLVLVESVKVLQANMKQASPLEQLLLANYNIARGHYEKVKEIFNIIESQITDEVQTISDNEWQLMKLLQDILREKMGTEDFGIIHKPYGNNNPYKPLLCERYPKICTEADTIRIEAQLWPESASAEVVMKLVVNNDMSIISGNYIREENSFYRWDIGPFKYSDMIVYSFEVMIEDSVVFNSESYIIDICKSEKLQFEKVVEDQDGFVVQLKDLYDESIDLRIRGDHPSHLSLIVSDKSTQKTDLNNEENGQARREIHQLLNENVSIELVNGNEELTIKSNDKTIWIQGIYIQHSKIEGIQKIYLKMKKEETECFYGFGERYNSLNQAGELIDNYVYNQYKDQGIKTYIPMPYYLSSNGYGCLLDTAYYSTFDMGKTSRETVTIEVMDRQLKVELFFGSLVDVVQEFTTYVGKPAMLPKWAFGPWMSSNNWDSQAEVDHQLQQTQYHDIPSTVLVIEAWSDEVTYYAFNDASYETKPSEQAYGYEDYDFPDWGRWPDPKAMVNKLHDNNIKCILWQIPILKNLQSLYHLQNEMDHDYAINHDYVVKNQDGTPYRIAEDWFMDSYVLDFTNEEAKDWWFDKRRYLIDQVGIDGFKTDGGECIFGKELSFHDGSSGAKMRNLYSNLYIQSYYDYINERTQGNGITFSRSGYTGAQNAPAHWAGDERSTFEAFKRSLLAGLSSGLSGLSFWGWDLAGFSGEVPTDELFIRSAAMATFCPIMQYHAESKGEFNQDRTPWNIAERSNNPKVIAIYRYFAKLRMNLLPYIYQEASYSSMSGEPMMRALILDYPEDQEVINMFDCYQFGRNLLVAPIIEKGASDRVIYLPEGRWYDFFTGKEYSGGNYIDKSVKLEEIPVFVKENSLIPLALNEALNLGEYDGNELESYPILGLMCHGDTFSESFYDGTLKLEFTKNGSHIQIDYTGERKIVIISTERKLFHKEKPMKPIKTIDEYTIYGV
jgi:alpha-glucosidase (family GH31 glycosyl hydrolase)